MPTPLYKPGLGE